MPGPLKNNPKNTTGLIIGKVSGKRSRVALPIPPQTPRTGDRELDQYITQLRDELDRLKLLVHQHEQKLNRMQVDPVTKIVTFIA